MAKNKANDEATGSQNEAGTVEKVESPVGSSEDVMPLAQENFVEVKSEPEGTVQVPEKQAEPEKVNVTNVSGMTLTIKSRGSLVFPSGRTDWVSREEAEFWVSKKWVVIQP